MSKLGSSSSLPTISMRLTSITSHLSLPSIRSEGPQKKKVVICRSLGPDVMPLILESDQELEVVVWPEDRQCDREWLMENIVGATGVLVMLSDKVTPELLDKAGSSLCAVSTMSVGYEHVDLAALAARNIRLGYTPDVLTDAVADISVMLALMAGRNVRDCLDVVNKGNWRTSPWSPFSFCGPQLSLPSSPHCYPSGMTKPTRTAGFLGFGRIAQATLRRLIPFGITHVLYTSNPNSSSSTSIPSDLITLNPTRVDLDTLASQSDIVFVLAPGGPSTHHIISSSFLRRMKPTSILVNTSRGTLVDSDALATALAEKWIWGAGIDVVEGEPNVARDHPLVKEKRCLVLPHVGSATLETRRGMATLAAKNLLEGVRGAPMDCELDVKARFG